VGLCAAQCMRLTHLFSACLQAVTSTSVPVPGSFTQACLLPRGPLSCASAMASRVMTIVLTSLMYWEMSVAGRCRRSVHELRQQSRCQLRKRHSNIPVAISCVYTVSPSHELSAGTLASCKQAELAGD
jgi:hypothetical protein